MTQRPQQQQPLHRNGIGVPSSDVGFWSGLIEGAFALTQTVFMPVWGKIADRYGRKWVLVLSLVGVVVASVLFGLARNVGEMIAIRCFEGIFAGTLVTVRTMVTENSTSKTQARAFSFFDFTGNLGIFVGSLLGGVLAEPALQYPSLFGSIALFKRYPYLLPCIVNGALATLAAVMNIFWLKETYPARKDDEPTPPSPSIRDVFRAPGMIPILVLMNFMMLIAFGFHAAMPVLFFTPVELGGWGFTPAQISYYFAAGGVTQSIWLLLAFPPMYSRLGTKYLTRLWTFVLPFTYGCMILQNWALRRGDVPLFGVLMALQLLTATGAPMVPTAFQLALNNILLSPHALGTLSGLSLSLSSAIRSFAPPAFASLYALGVKEQIMAGQLGVVVPAILSAVLFVMCWIWLPEGVDERKDTAKSGKKGNRRGEA
ncbi:MFS general substrate transporter [Dacryopinax primogenitus]|uniref:MFS general substrate transporter n=1 Tax=Dacryopinax primogenitus (strain DJM 731) TaxID=1858805 RepID=M5GAF4_DACPD|nr:MFS general substrate transporter [Dacryopinax primogenitus]EJU02927.1 MFS general substrate transporter [Dacryopinax primogenitus]